MKKNKKIILLSVGGVGFFAITSVAIAIPVVLASSNSDKQIVKNAQVALEELTIDQRTVDLTKDDNKKLPSKIGTKIISMEILNGLLKKAIATLNGITYTPKVIKTNDEQGKIEVEIEIKKGVVIEIVNFTIVGFKSQAQVDVAAAKAVLDSLVNTNIIDDSQTASQVSYESLDDFFEKTALDAPTGNDDIALSKVTITIAGTPKGDNAQTVIFTISSKVSGASATSELEVTSFKSSLLVQKEADVAAAKAVLDSLVNTNIIDDSQSASQVSYESLDDFFEKTALDAPTGNDDIALSKVTITIAGTPKGDNAQTVIFTISSKVSGASATSELEVTSFKSSLLVQKEADVTAAKAVLDNLVNTNILNNSQSASQVSYESLDDFFEKTALDAPIGNDYTALSKVTIVVEAIAKGDSSQTITFTISSKASGASTTSELEVTGFKSLLLVQKEVDVAAAKAVLDSLANTNILDDSQSAFQVSYDSVADFFEKTALETPTGDDDTVLSKVIITIVGTPKGDTSQTVVFTISSKPSGVNATSELEVTDFKSQAQVDVDNELIKIENSTIKGDKFELPSKMNLELIKDLIGFPQTNNGVEFNADLKSHNDEDGTIIITLIATKNGATKKQELIISGFDLLHKEIIVAKTILDKWQSTEIKDETKFASDIYYDDLDDFIKQTSLPPLSQEEKKILNKVKIDIQWYSQGNSSQIVEIGIWKPGNEEVLSTIMVNGFKSKT